MLSDLDDAAPRAAVVVVSSEAARARVTSLPGIELVARITPPNTLYLRLLRSSLVTAVLRSTRPGPRFQEYEKKIQPWALWVYRAQ